MHYLVLNSKLFSEVSKTKTKKLFNRQATITDTPVSQSGTTYSMPSLCQTPCWERNTQSSSGDKIPPLQVTDILEAGERQTIYTFSLNNF